jgi:PAS domain S-box-containing protein
MLNKKIRQEAHESMAGYDELVMRINEILKMIKAEMPMSTIVNLPNVSPGLRPIAELINEVILTLHEQNEFQMTELELIMQASNIGLWDMLVVKGDPVNPSNAFHWTEKFRHLLGYSNEIDFPNVLSSWSDRLHPEDKKRALESFAQHLLDRSGKTPFDIEYRLLKKNGEYAHFHAYGSTVRDEQGYALRVAGAIQDITEVRKAVLEKETMDLRLSLLQKSINIALWDLVVDPKDPVGGNNEFWWSPEFRNMLGFSNEHDFPNVLCSWSNRLHPEDKEKTLNAFASHLLDKTGHTPYNLEYRIKRKTGEYIRLKAGGSTLRDKNGTPLRVIGSVEDVSDLWDKAAMLDEHVDVFSQAIEGMTQQIEAIITATAGVAQAQASNLSILAESEKNADEMRSIISAIQDVASQSNVLGINASIEAARAGQAGKGFTVVSEEVRKLASNSKSSADQIKCKVKSVQNSTSQISDAIKETDVLVNKQKDIIALLKENLASVNTMYGELVKMISSSTRR